MMKHIYISLLTCLMMFLCNGNVQAQKFEPHDVAPMIKTQWGQRYPYNAMSPKEYIEGEFKTTPTGCAPIAVAQILYFFKYPKSILTPEGRLVVPWDSIPAVPTKRLKPDESSRIAALVRVCGLLAFTKYNIGGSPSSLSMIMNSLKQMFGFSPYISMYNKANFCDPNWKQRWKETIYKELMAGRPVLMSATGPKGYAHIFILDGISHGMVHINFGWEGKDDGYYSLNSMNGFTGDPFIIVDLGNGAYRPEITEVKISAAGTLSKAMSEEDFQQIRHMCITGPLNKEDFKFLHYLAHYNTKKGHTAYLTTLDLKDAEATEIPDSAFKGTSLQYVQLPRATRRIGIRAFEFCHCLNQVDIPDSVSDIGFRAFRNCESLLMVHIPSHLTALNSSTFEYCTNLITVTIPPSVTTIDNAVFRGCTRLKIVKMPSGILHMGTDVFKDCAYKPDK